jgi:hypothetical protein
VGKGSRFLFTLPAAASLPRLLNKACLSTSFLCKEGVRRLAKVRIAREISITDMCTGRHSAPFFSVQYFGAEQIPAI